MHYLSLSTYIYIYIYICIYIYIYIYTHQQGGIRNRTEPAEPNRAETFDSGTDRNRTQNRTEPDRRRVRKTKAQPRRTGKCSVPNRTESNRLILEKSGTETNRTEPVPSWIKCFEYQLFQSYKLRYITDSVITQADSTRHNTTSTILRVFGGGWEQKTRIQQPLGVGERLRIFQGVGGPQGEDGESGRKVAESVKLVRKTGLRVVYVYVDVSQPDSART